MVIHTGEFQCHICKKSFTHLKTHMIIHTGEEAFQCQICEKSFLRKRDLKIHLVTHTGERVVQCHICENHLHVHIF